MIIDAHAHIFPEKIAERAVAGIGSFYDLNMTFDGKVSTLINVGDKAGIDKFVVHSVATNEAQVESINNFIADSVKAYPDRLIGFATIHPSFADIPAEIERAVSLGLKGVKIHPDFQQFEIDCREAYKIYECIEGRLPLLVPRVIIGMNGQSRSAWQRCLTIFQSLMLLVLISEVGLYGNTLPIFCQRREYGLILQALCMLCRRKKQLSLLENTERTGFFLEPTILCGTHPASLNCSAKFL
jgi:hypothetical protein